VLIGVKEMENRTIKINHCTSVPAPAGGKVVGAAAGVVVEGDNINYVSLTREVM